MSDFRPIESQEQLDAVIGERISRAEEKYASQYKEYSSPEAVSKIRKEYEDQINALSASAQNIEQVRAEYDAQIGELNSRIASYETASVKTRIAHEMGLSYDAIQYISGDTEEAIKQSAKGLKSLIGTATPQPLKSNESKVVDKNTAALKQMLGNLNLGGN